MSGGIPFTGVRLKLLVVRRDHIASNHIMALRKRGIGVRPVHLFGSLLSQESPVVCMPLLASRGVGETEVHEREARNDENGERIVERVVSECASCEVVGNNPCHNHEYRQTDESLEHNRLDVRAQETLVAVLTERLFCHDNSNQLE